MSAIRVVVDAEVLEKAKEQYETSRNQKMIAARAIEKVIKEIEVKWTSLMDKTFYQAFEKTMRNIETSDRKTEDIMEALDEKIDEAKEIENMISGAMGRPDGFKVMSLY